MKGYETVFITHPDLEEDKLKNLIKKFKGLIKKAKGKLVYEYLWGRRKLAYQIANQDFGVYHIWYLTGSGTMLEELQKQFRFTDELIRFQSIMVNDIDEESRCFSEMLKVQQEEAASRPDSTVSKPKASPEDKDKNLESKETSSKPNTETKETDAKETSEELAESASQLSKKEPSSKLNIETKEIDAKETSEELAESASQLSKKEPSSKPNTETKETDAKKTSEEAAESASQLSKADETESESAVLSEETGKIQTAK